MGRTQLAAVRPPRPLPAGECALGGTLLREPQRAFPPARAPDGNLSSGEDPARRWGGPVPVPTPQSKPAASWPLLRGDMRDGGSSVAILVGNVFTVLLVFNSGFPSL